MTKNTYYDKGVNKALKQLNSKKEGLTNSQAKSRLQKYGSNELKKEKTISPLKVFLRQFQSPLVWVLIAAMFISLGVAFIEKANPSLKDLSDVIVIAIIVVFNAILGFIQEYKAEKAIDELKKLSSPKSLVLRNGKQVEVDAKNLVPGDILILQSGDKIPADGRLIETNELYTQEAALTGESTPISKKTDKLSSNLTIGDRKNSIFSGTIVTKGRGKALVTKTGMDSEIGKIAHMISTAKAGKTPLQQHLAKLGKFLTYLTGLICILIFATGIIKGFLTTGVDIHLIKTMLIASIALAVAAIPEGLPAVVTISLALGVRRMVKRNALVRKLPSVETLGATTVISSDKTGTLTHNQMTVTKIFANDNIINVTGRGYEPKGEFSQKDNIETLLKAGALCNDAQLKKEGNEWKIYGDPTEGALIVSAKKYGLEQESLNKKQKRTDEIGFTSERKRMTTVHKDTAYMKGAPDVILDLCNKIEINGKVRKLTEKKKKEILNQNEEFAKEALRVLGFAYKPIKGKYTKNNLEKDFIFLGLQGMIDPPREEVKDSIKECHEAGIKVIMATGDHITTAKAIAKDLGIKGKAITGDALEKMSDKKLKKEVKKIAVYARVNPEHKIRIVKALKSNSNVTAMTGDGVNDAPALKKADIGVAMGISGTDVSKEASDMILMDDNFSSIVNAVEEGRIIYDNIKKFVMYMLSSNLGEVFTVFFGILFTKLPVVALQILWINIVTDGFLALAMGVEPGEKGIMKRKPRKKSEGIVTRRRFTIMIGIGLFVMLGTLGLFNFYPTDSLEHARTMAFTSLVIFQVFNVLNLQSSKESVAKTFFRNKWMALAIISTVLLQFLVVHHSFFNEIFHTVPLAMMDWIYIGIVSASLLVVAEIIKAFRRKNSNSS